ncbi:MAG TPA: tyrosine-type recombinase/integrase [Anaeromyxobacteraceae bacterium]|nr:tyrosine-type recombinase/integrase [Anaeromyxobacteraceae bacterium]
MKRLADAAKEYLAVRRALGFKLYHQTWWLPDFVAYLKAQGSAVITTKLALRWAQKPDASPRWWAARLRAVRHFARHHRASDPRTEVPPSDLIPYRKLRLSPHLYATDEITTLMREATGLRHPLRAASYPTVIGLLAVTGMRISEALALDDDDLDWERALLTVRSSKFGKSRHVPLHRTTLAALGDYIRRRDRLRPHRRSPALFLSNTGTRVISQNFQHVFLQLLERTGLDRGRGRRPRIHDLRHTFAMKIVRDWYRAGVDVERRLPWLSTYLGHVSPSSTYWYLTATPELLTAASARAERAWKVRS